MKKEIIRENIECSAQMFYVMTLDEDLEIFNLVNRIITEYLPSGQIDIYSSETFKDLQLYVFNDSFRDLKSGVLYKRTHPEERKIFYRQMFNAGSGGTNVGIVVNRDFNTLLEKLLLESVNYIEKIWQRETPHSFVSIQNICQAVEDLQYNLSTHCTGMAKIASPIINKELDFVIQRFMKNDELIKQMTRYNSNSFWKLIERMLADLRNEVPNISALRNKAIFGHKIISTIAKYTKGYLDDDKILSEFIAI